MQICAESLSRNSKSAQKSETKQGPVCKRFFRQGAFCTKTPQKQEALRKKWRRCHDSISRYFEQHDLLVLPGQKYRLFDYADHCPEDKRDATAQAGKPSPR